jgi:tripartite-type tricarboxylate transporter receptor subunit TctC
VTKVLFELFRSVAGRAITAAGITFLAAGAAAAADYPEKPIRLIVPYASGGSTDAVARIIGDAISGPLGQQIVVENKPGAAGNIALEMVAKSAPDGYTLLLGAGSTLTVNPSLYKSNPVDVEKDLVPVAMLVSSQYMLVVNPTLKASSVKDLVALAKAQPGKLNYASGGKGSPLHLGAEMLKSQAKIDMVQIPYRGGGPASKSVMTNETQVLFGSFPTTLPKVQDGSLKALAVTGSKRSPALPDIPTMEEAGFPGYLLTSWQGILAPAGTPKPAIDRLNTVIKAALATEGVKQKIEAQGLEVDVMTQAQFATTIKEDLVRWRKVIQDAGIPAE